MWKHDVWENSKIPEEKHKPSKEYKKVRETLNKVSTPKGEDIEYLESLILAQDERWRRA